MVEVSARLGHSGIATTQRIYAHELAAGADRASAAIAARCSTATTRRQAACKQQTAAGAPGQRRRAAVETGGRDNAVDGALWRTSQARGRKFETRRGPPSPRCGEGSTSDAEAEDEDPTDRVARGWLSANQSAETVALAFAAQRRGVHEQRKLRLGVPGLRNRHGRAAADRSQHRGGEGRSLWVVAPGAIEAEPAQCVIRMRHCFTFT